MKPGMFYLFQNQNYLDLKPYQAGYADNDGKASFGPAARNHYLFHYVISGAGTLLSNEKDGKEHQFYIHSGQGFMIFPSQLTTYWADEAHPWEYVWIEFDGVFAPEIVKRSGLTIEAPVYSSSDKTITAGMAEAMLELAKPTVGTSYYDVKMKLSAAALNSVQTEETQFYKISRLYQFADCLIRSSASAKRHDFNGSMSDYYLQTAFSYIEQNFMDPITVESIAECCNIHRNQLLKIFKNKLKKGPQAYLIEYRMSKAAQLLATTELSVNEIGNAVGYPNQLHFSRAFKSVYGVSPTQYKGQLERLSEP